MDYELYHAGVKGMKWGVRKEKTKTASVPTRRQSLNNATVTKASASGNTTTISSRQGTSRAKLTIKKNKGAKLVAKTENAKVKVVLSNTANVTAGALRVAAAFIPGASVLNGVATGVSLVGTLANLK